MSAFIRKFFQGIGLIPKDTSTADEAGELEVLSSDNRLRYHDGITVKSVVLDTSTDTLENKSIDADTNTISNLVDGNIKTGAAINAEKIADGTVDNTEFQTLNGVTSNIQTQLNNIVDGSTPLTLNLNNNNTFVGNVSNIADQVDTSIVGDISADATGLNIKSGVIVDADISSSAAIDATKIANGTVSSTEFQYLDGVTSGIQGQLDNKASSTDLSNHINDIAGAHAASAISVTPAGGITSDNAQDALEELDSELDNHINDASTHGVSGSIVGTSDTQALTNKDIDGGTASNTSRITLPKNTKANLDALTRKEGTLVYATDEDKVYYDDGTTLQEVGSGGGANTALSNLASVAINTTLVSDTNNTDDLGTDAIEWKDVYAHSLSHNDATNPDLNVQTTDNNGSIIVTAHGTGNLDIKATKVRRSVNGASTDFMEEQYYDALTLAANTSSPTTISSLTFATASFNVVVLDYMIKEATSNKVRVGTLRVATDGTNVDVTDVYNETALLGSATGLSLSAVVNGANIEIQFDDTHATNACTMRVLVKRYRA